MRGILRFGSRTILLHIAAAVVIGLVASYAVISAPDSLSFEVKKAFWI